MEIVSGRTGKPHVTSQQFRQLIEGTVGQGSCILTSGENLEPELASNNSLKIRSGMLAHHGNISSVKIGTYDAVNLSNGSQGMKRIDLVVCRYTRNAETEVESCNWVVIMGTPVSSNPVAPTYTVGNLQEGDLVDDCPVFEVHYDGINVTEVKKILSVAPNLTELNSKIVSLAEWKQSFLGKCVYRLQFGNSNNGIIQTNQLSIPWRPEEVTVELFGLNIQGAGAVPIDYKVACLSEQGGLYVYCSTPGASGVNLLPWQVVDATILIQRK